jgi:acyl-CoA dehydrogenase family member 9
MQTSSHDASVSLTIGAHSSIGMKGILLFGTPEQQARYLPKLATGEYIAAFCLTESGAGSDAASIRTTAKQNDDGSWTLNGEKIWITNGGIAQVYTVFARTEGTDGKITAFIVEADWPGVSHGAHEDKMGIRASSTTVVSFSDVRIPADNVLGDAGKGFKVAMAILNNGRTGLGGGAVGTMKRLIRLATHQASERRQFGQPIANYGLVREKIAQMMIDCFAAESTVWMLAHYIDSGCEDYSTEAAISKIFASDAVQRCGHEALQIAAGNGFMREYPYEQIVRDSRILSIFEGTNEILRLFVALAGLKDAGRALSELKSAVDDIFNNRSRVSACCRGMPVSACRRRPVWAVTASPVVCRRNSPTRARRSRSTPPNSRRPPTTCCASSARASSTGSMSSSASPTSPSICSSACARCRAPRRWPQRKTPPPPRPRRSRTCSCSRPSAAWPATSAG